MNGAFLNQEEAKRKNKQGEEKRKQREERRQDEKRKQRKREKTRREEKRKKRTREKTRREEKRKKMTTRKKNNSSQFVFKRGSNGRDNRCKKKLLHLVSVQFVKNPFEYRIRDIKIRSCDLPSSGICAMISGELKMGSR